MLSTIPFDITFEVPAPFAGRTVMLRLDMTSDDGLEEMIDMFDCLCGLAQRGAFTAGLADEGRPAAAWASEATVRGTLWQRALSLGDLHMSFWKALLQMSVQCHYQLASIYRLSVTPETLDAVKTGRLDGPSISLSDVLNAPDPPAPRHLPFRLVRSDDVPGDVVTIRATTAVPVDDELFGDLKQAFEDWGSLVYVGGFAAADEVMEEYQLERVEVGRLHPTLIECAAIGWNAPRHALDCAIRMCSGLHHTVVPIVEVEVES